MSAMMRRGRGTGREASGEAGRGGERLGAGGNRRLGRSEEEGGGVARVRCEVTSRQDAGNQVGGPWACGRAGGGHGERGKTSGG